MHLLNIRKSTKRYIPYATVYNGPISSKQGINGLSSARLSLAKIPWMPDLVSPPFQYVVE